MPAKSTPAKPANFLGLELSAEQLRASVIDERLEVIGSEHVDFDSELSEYQTRAGVFTSAGDTYTTPVDMWVKAVDLLLDKLRKKYDLSKIRSISGCAHHASVWWTQESAAHLSRLSPQQSLHAQLGNAATFSILQIPVAQDTSTVTQSLALESALGGPDQMANRVGTAAHSSLTAAQLMRIRETNPDAWAKTARITLAGAFLCSIFLGGWAPMSESEVSGTGMWSVQNRAWDEAALEVVAGSNEGGQRLKEVLGSVELFGGKKLGNISPYFVERFGFEQDTFLCPFTSDYLATYISLSPSASDAVASFGSADALLMSSTNYLPTRFYNLYPHPAQDPAEKRRYISMILSRNADVPRALVRDMYTKSWSAFDRLVAVVPPGGSIGLDDKLFSFWLLQGEGYPFSHVKGIFRFETGIKVNEFRDLRANPRCLLESQILSFRVRFARMVASGLFYPNRSSKPVRGGAVASSLGVNFDPYDSSVLPRRILAIGGAANFPSVVNLLGDVFNAPIFVPANQLEAEPIHNAQTLTVPARAALGSAYMARWAWRRSVRPEERHASIEDEIRWLLGKKWTASGGSSKSKLVPPGLHHHPKSGLAASSFAEEEEDEEELRNNGLYQAPDISVAANLAEFNMTPRSRTSTSGSGITTSIDGSLQPSTAATSSPGGIGPSPLAPVTPLPTDDSDQQLGLLKVADPDVDSFMTYAAIVPEYCRLETLLVKSLV